MGCTSFKRHDPSPVGIFYLNHPIQGEYFTKDDFFHSENKISFSQPVIIKAEGIMTWNSLTGQKTKVALFHPKLDHRPNDFWIDTDGDYYVNIAWLKAHGRIVYTGFKTSGDYFWEGVASFLTSPFGVILVLIVLGFFIYVILRKPIHQKNSYVNYNTDSYNSENNSDETFISETNRESEEENFYNTRSTIRCEDCQSIDLSGYGFISKGNGMCKVCDGTGHDQGTEALVQFTTLGLLDDKYDCETCSGTGQCQTCGGTGLVYN